MQTLLDRPDVRAAATALDEQAVHAFVSLLSPREAVVFQQRFRGYPQRRWESLARAMGIQRHRVRQLEIEIIKKFDAWLATRPPSGQGISPRE
jgi:DNA-directed RNA polymerase sigma subunit (sigma70/sigma32)